MKSIKLADILIIFFILLLTGAVVYKFFLKKGAKEYVIIKTPYDEYIYPLDKDRELTVKGILGESKITIKDNDCYFQDSVCKSKYCVSLKGIKKLGFIACIPNCIYIKLESGAKIKWEEIDSVVY